MKIGLLLCDHVAENLQSISGDYPAMFTAWFARCAPKIQLEFFDVCNGEFPATLDACDAFITTGSKLSVYDAVPWIHALKQFVRDLTAAEKPYIGICFGHQLLAEALGGHVAKASTGWGVGILQTKILRQESWMQPAAAHLNLHFMHQDQVQQLPENAVILGQSEHCEVVMFRVGTSLGLQAHPEFSNVYSEALMQGRTERIGAPRVEAANRSFSQKTDEEVMANWILKFIDK